MVLYGRSSFAAAADGTRRDPNSVLEESMRQLRLDSNSKDCPYPERPGEQDCNYFIRTGSCSYGARCRYNHPRDRGAVSNPVLLGASEYPERVGQPVCEYFVKTWKCRFGSTCKYHHPKEGVGSVSLNHYGYPLRQGEKDCSYYVKTGQCKFGSACKFNHPGPVSSSVPSPAPSVYPIVQPTSVPSPQQYPFLGSWQVGGPSISPASYMPCSYGSVLISPNNVPVPGWSPYPMFHAMQPSVNPAVSPGGQQMVQTGLSYGPLYQSSPSMLAHPGPYSPTGLSIIHQKENKLPERPGQPICQYYMRTGVCKFGKMCKYHHPSAWYTPYPNCILSPLGLPLRLGPQPCPEYAQHGVCHFGPTCNYDHPVGKLSYSPSASSLSDMPVAPYPMGFCLATLAPSTSYPELQP